MKNILTKIIVLLTVAAFGVFAGLQGAQKETTGISWKKELASFIIPPLLTYGAMKIASRLDQNQYEYDAARYAKLLDSFPIEEKQYRDILETKLAFVGDQPMHKGKPVKILISNWYQCPERKFEKHWPWIFETNKEYLVGIPHNTLPSQAVSNKMSLHIALHILCGKHEELRSFNQWHTTCNNAIYQSVAAACAAIFYNAGQGFYNALSCEKGSQSYYQGKMCSAGLLVPLLGAFFSWTNNGPLEKKNNDVLSHQTKLLRAIEARVCRRHGSAYDLELYAYYLHQKLGEYFFDNTKELGLVSRHNTVKGLIPMLEAKESVARVREQRTINRKISEGPSCAHVLPSTLSSLIVEYLLSPNDISQVKNTKDLLDLKPTQKDIRFHPRIKQNSLLHWTRTLLSSQKTPKP